MNAANPHQRSPLLAAYAALVFAFIYLPIGVLIVYSFNRDGVGGFPPRHFTFGWYRQLFADSAILPCLDEQDIWLCRYLQSCK